MRSKHKVAGRPALTDEVMLIDARRAAMMLGICTRTLLSLKERGEIRHVKIGRAVRYSVEELRKWVEAKSKETTGRSNPERPGGNMSTGG